MCLSMIKGEGYVRETIDFKKFETPLNRFYKLEKKDEIKLFFGSSYKLVGTGHVRKLWVGVKGRSTWPGVY